VEQTREHASDILDYFRNKDEVLSCGDMSCLERNYLDKHESVNRTAIALTEKGLALLLLGIFTAGCEMILVQTGQGNISKTVRMRTFDFVVMAHIS